MIAESIKSSDTANSVTIKGHYIEVLLDGPQTTGKARQTNLEALAAGETFKSQKSPILLLLRIRNHPRLPNMGAFQEYIKIFRAVKFDKLAVSGKIPPMIKSLVITVISSFNKELEIAYFADENAAVEWLKKPKK